MRAVILAAGLGTRLRPMTNELPKCLLTIGGQPVLARQKGQLAAVGIEEVRVVVGGSGDVWTDANRQRIAAIFSDCAVNDRNETTDHGFSLSLGLDGIETGPVLILDGDLVFSDAALAESLRAPGDTVLISRQAIDEREPGGHIELAGDRVIACGRHHRPAAWPWHIYSGMMRLGPALLPDLKRALAEPANRELDILGCISRLAAEHDVRVAVPGLPPMAAEKDAPFLNWVNLNTKEHYETAERMFGSEDTAHRS